MSEHIGLATGAWRLLGIVPEEVDMEAQEMLVRELRVWCSCGWGPMLRVAGARRHGESYPCYEWRDALTGRRRDRCPRCGQPTSLLTTQEAQPAAAGEGE